MSKTEAVRAFNRFYTKQIGLLNGHYLHSGLSLTQVRVLYELAHRESPTASEVGTELGLDAGYLSRIVKAFAGRGLLRRERSKADGREHHLTMTKAGHAMFAPLEDRARAEVQSMMARLSGDGQDRLIASMQTIEGLLGEQDAAYTLRPHQPGDIGWAIERHGVLYTREYGWDPAFEALVAEIAAKFLHNFDAKRERCWIAERGGERLGCVFLVRKSQATAQLRMLLVEPSARGLGLGNRLVQECIDFARQTGYRKIMLWTNSALAAARHIYAKVGFEIVAKEEETSRLFHHGQVSETWELELPRSSC